jgi:hypothetical protein
MPWRLLIDAAEIADGSRQEQAPDRTRIRVRAHSAVLLVADNVTI